MQYAIRRAHYLQACLSSSAPEDIIVCIPLRTYNMSREYIRIFAVKDVRQRVPCPRDTVAVYVLRTRKGYTNIMQYARGCVRTCTLHVLADVLGPWDAYALGTWSHTSLGRKRVSRTYSNRLDIINE